MDPITIAMGLAQFAPGIIKLLTGSDKAGEVAGKVIDVAKAVTGTPDPQVAVATIQADPSKVLEFQQAMGAQQGELEKAYLADRSDARSHDTEIRKLNGGHNYRADLAVMSVVIGLITCLYVLVQLKGQITGEAIGIISTIAGLLGSCLKDYFAFEFGSSRSSRDKDELIARMKT